MSRHQDGTIWVSSDEEKLEFKDKNGDNNKDNVENNENGNKSVEDETCVKASGWYNLCLSWR